MTRTEFADLAEKHRDRLVRLTVSRGHDTDTAQDIVQDAIIVCLSAAHHYRTNLQAIDAIKKTSWQLSGNGHFRESKRAKYVVRLLEDVEAEQRQDLEHDNSVELRDVQIDVRRAIAQLPNQCDRELADLVLCQGYTQSQAFNELSEHYTSETKLRLVLNAYIIPTLKELLSDYYRKQTIRSIEHERDDVQYLVFEQHHNTTEIEKLWCQNFITLKPVTTRRQTAYEAGQLKELLEKRFREQELACRIDHDRLVTRNGVGPLASKLNKLGNRPRTRLFAVRKAQ